TSEAKFSEISKKIGFAALKKFNPYVRFSEHPYVEAKIKGTKVNVVPCYIVEKGKWKSSADRTQFHTKFMLENLSGSMKNNVRLLKQFLKNNGIYGAEISQQGFSGYVSEVLVWNYGSFEGVIKAMSKIKPGEVIGKASKKFDTPITIVDPIDSQRNLAAAISNENIGKFVLLCRNFVKKPSMAYFKQRKIRSSKSLLENCVVLNFKYKPRSPDIIWGQIKRASNAISTQLELSGFEVIRSKAYTDEKNDAFLIFLLESPLISKYYVKEGPEFFNADDSGGFVIKNEKTSLSMWVGKNKKINALEKRAENDCKKFLRNVISKGLDKSGIPKGIKSDIQKGYKISDGRKASKSIKAQLLELISTDAAIFSSN
ncbi:MAG: CCA tRNA nucleotidyltransferase, partial [Nitrosopumilaceae archaeon]|nr:CCA tRNA nucleotidyltransferase [Nitrosopumilaceae archaeon]